MKKYRALIYLEKLENFNVDCLLDSLEHREKKHAAYMTEYELNAEALLRLVQPIYIHIKLMSQQATLYTKVKKFLAHKRDENHELIVAFDDISGIITPRQIIRYK